MPEKDIKETNIPEIVSQKLAIYSPEMRKKILFLRKLILEVAQENSDIGQIEETLKWGQISYLTTKPKTGTTIRIDKLKDDSGYALFVPCSTSLVETYKDIFPNTFKFEGSRAMLFNENQKLPVEELKYCIYLALTYHLRKV